MLKVHYRIDSSPTLAPVLSQLKPGHMLSFYLIKIHLNIVVKSMLGVMLVHKHECKWDCNYTSKIDVAHWPSTCRLWSSGVYFRVCQPMKLFSEFYRLNINCREFLNVSPFIVVGQRVSVCLCSGKCLLLLIKMFVQCNY
jgi:hypothetical protein